MTQIIVNFLQPNTVGSTTLSTDPRVFDFEISSTAQTYYNYELCQILLGMGAQIQDSNGVLHAPTPDTLNAGTIVFSGPTNAQTVSDAINLLNNWAAMKIVNAGGAQTSSFGAIGTTVGAQGTVLATDPTTGAIIYPTVAAPGLNLNTNPPTLTLIPSDSGASGVPALDTTMDQYMGQALDKLIRSLRAAGWDPIGNPGTSAAATTALANVTGPTTTSIYGLAGVLQQAASAAVQAHLVNDAAVTDSMSIQQVLMVDYVSRGNEILFNEMQLLKNAIDINQQALSYLNSLQDLMNQKDPQKFIMQLQDLNSVNVNTTNPQSQFDTFEKDTYDQSLATISRLGSASGSPTDNAAYAAYFNGLATGSPITPSDPLSVGSFNDLSTAVNNVAAFSVTTITNNLQYLITQVGAQGGSQVSGGLISALTQIKTDFTGLATTNSATAIQQWIQDTQTSDPGSFQRDLSNAIVSSQSFNDTERENLREVMFVYEEFYKSATGLLSRLTQLIEKMADGIAR